MAAKPDVTMGGENVRFEIRGLRETVKHLQKAGARSEDLKEVMVAISSIVISAAHPPVLSGDLRGTVRPSQTKNKAVVRAGSKRTPYAGPIHFGWRKRNIRPQRFLTEAIQKTQSEVLKTLDDGLGKILQKEGLL